MSRIAFLALVAIAMRSPHDLSSPSFDVLHRLICPQPGEFAWYEEIPWLTSVQEAREKAAREGKPILVWCSADGQPCGAT
jgi:hypothetical protein